ncbi:MAG: ATP-grasp domain-containing protein [Ilumatobacter sp.]|nr:ATP-grasp domain-containing protein [Ilumatobacter sp.]
MVTVVFVAPYALDATNRFLAAMADLPDVAVVVVSSDPVERFPERVTARLSGHWHVANCLDVDQLTAAVAELRDRLGGVDVLTAILENLQVPLAHVRERVGIAGMGVDVAERFRDKSQMKAAFEAAGIPCARSGRAASADEVRDVFDRWRRPVVVKPLAGMGARNTFRVDDAESLERWLGHSPPSADAPVLLEEFLVGQEFSFESVLVDSEMVWHSIGRYDPTPLTVLENPWIQWCVVLPREIDGDEFATIRDVGASAVRALGLTTGLSHLEWFRRPDGTIAISEVGARPPGAQIASLMSWAHDTDLYATWARLVALGEFDPPSRRYAVGAAYLRAQGAGRVISGIHGIERVSAATHELVVESSIPAVGRAPADTYEGDGYVIVRADTTGAVDAALAEIVATIRVEAH